jgi:serum/glucocorticoid-regulated kinase 3
MKSGMRLPLLPPKKIIGAFEPEFLAKRQFELGQWLDHLLSSHAADPLRDTDSFPSMGVNPHENEDILRFLTYKADQPPFPVEPPIMYHAPSSAMNHVPFLSRHPVKSRRVCLADFKMIQVIGRGSFGKVVLVVHIESKQLFAMKILNKANIVKRKQVEHTQTERRVLVYAKHPFIVGLHFAFHTPQRLYFVLDYCPGGELFYHLTRMKKLPEHMACFYAAEITCALDHLHSLGVVYRDLKPENILLTRDGHVKLGMHGLSIDLDIFGCIYIYIEYKRSFSDVCFVKLLSLGQRWTGPCPGDNHLQNKRV